MKISKLFHWLYGLLMLLPIFAIGSTILVNTFNKEIYAGSANVEYYETNVVESMADIKVGNIYEIDLEWLNESMGINQNYDVDSLLIYGRAITITNDEYYVTNYIEYFSEKYVQLIVSEIYDPDSDTFSYGVTFSNDGNPYISFVYSFARLYIIYQDIDTSGLVTFDSSTIYNAFKESDYLPIKEVVDLEDGERISDVFYYSVDKVVESSLFNWAYNSNILGVPISYIGGIFGLASYSIVNVLLCYWVAISIIWLVFDILMFVPMLIHKTLDKMRF